MRRIVGFVLLGLGVFAVALGLLLRLYAYPRLAKAPLDVDQVSVATATGVTALVIENKAPKIRDDLNLTATRWVKGDLTRPEVEDGGDVAAWIEAVEIVDQNGNRVKATERELCLNRRTNEAHEPCTQQYIISKTNQAFEEVREKDQDASQPGLSLKFPFDTEKRSYQVYDLSIRGQAEARFEGEEQINGLDVYRFVQDILPAKIESARKVPGSLVGRSETTVEADLYYQNKRTMWVEPATGQIIKGEEQQYQELVLNGQTPGQGTPVFKGTLTFNDDTVNKNVSDAEDNRSKLWLLTTLPIILWVVGAVLILGGIALLLMWRRQRPRTHQRPNPPQHAQLTGTGR